MNDLMGGFKEELENKEEELLGILFVICNSRYSHLISAHVPERTESGREEILNPPECDTLKLISRQQQLNKVSHCKSIGSGDRFTATLWMLSG